MAKYTNRIIGQAPGTIIHIGKRKAKRVTINIIDYNSNKFESNVIENAQEIFREIPENTKRWINIAGLHDTELIAKVGEHFNLHPIALENIANTMQKTGYSDYDDFIHIIANSVYWSKNRKNIETDQFSLIIGKNYLITFMEQETDILSPLLRRLENSKSRMRKLGVDYLGYAILDLIIDNYFAVIEDFEGRIESLEEILVGSPTPEVLIEIQALKRNLIFLRKSVWPYREVVSALQTTDSELISDDIYVYVKNLYDHTIQVIDIIETFRDMVAGMLDIYLSSVSNEMNKVMKVLTIIATIFIPITFIAGLYGMNFNTKSPFNMPELGWHYGYFFALGLMAAVVLVMIFYFKKKRWF